MHIKTIQNFLNPGLLFLAVCFPCFSQLTVGAELRPRALTDAGYAVPKPAGSHPHMYITQRTRLNALFTGEKTESYISIQDVRFWGDDDQFKASGTLGNTRSLSLHQGWFLFRPVEWLSLKVGRQILSYDDQRILSSRNWNDYQITYDAVLVQAIQKNHRADLGFSWNTSSSNYNILPAWKFRTFDFIRYAMEVDPLWWSAIVVVTGNSVTDTTDKTRYRATWGANAEYREGRAKARASVYYQHHLNRSARPLSAFCFSANAGWEIIPGRLIGNAGLDYISGQDGMRYSGGYQNTDHAFDLLYGRRHSWYGYMDYFSTMPPQGLQDYLVNLTVTVSGNCTVISDYHFFRLAAPMPDPGVTGEAMARHLGSELDLTLKWKINPVMELQAGYSFFLVTPTLETVKGITGTPLKFPQFTYLMVIVKPSLQTGSCVEGSR